MTIPPPIPMLAAAEQVHHRLTSTLVESFSQWWQMPLLVATFVAVGVGVLWLYRRDAAELPRGVGLVLATLRLAALAALAAAYLDFERTAEHEVVFPSRVAVLIDTSASMTLDDGRDAAEPARTRAERAAAVLAEGGLLAALGEVHEVSLWRFDADAEAVVVIPPGGGPPDGSPTGEGGPERWRERLAPRGFETRLGAALGQVLEQEPPGVLAGVVVLSDGANNAGLDPAAATGGLVRAGVPVHAIGIGSDTVPPNVRIADLVAPARVFPGDRFTVTGHVQAHGFAGQRARLELAERDAAGATRVIEAADVELGDDGTLAAARFDVPGLEATGRRELVLRIAAPAGDRSAADDTQAVDVEVVDRVTQVLLMAGGPSREYQFMRNVLERDKSFAVDVLLGTAAPGISQDARRILDGFPATAEELAEYDVIVAFDYDWRLLDAAAQGRLERWVAQESGGLVLVAGGVFTEAWLADPRTSVVRTLHPVELRRAVAVTGDGPQGREKPMPLAFTTDGQDAEFLWLAASRVASQTVWSEFKGVFACFPAAAGKPGATVYARARTAGGEGSVGAGEANPAYMVGQFYGSGSVFYLGSGEMWRLRGIDDAAYERYATQLLRHVSQGRLLRGSRRARLLVERDRCAVGASVVVRIVSAAGEGDPAGMSALTCQAVGPDGVPVRVPLVPEAGRPGIAQGAFVASREGTWRIDVDLGDTAGERLTRRIQARLPDRELERPRLDRGVLDQVALLSGGSARYLDGEPWTAAASASLARLLPDRTRREYETGVPDMTFKRRLNATLLAVACGLLCLEWIIRRVVRLA
ncbi:MAG: VWA domain-containing protein [Planctomycetia bacterium]|nr:VWA domain-containing protein [Planctomycetia bacterium]